jgi:mutator protein MutT
LTRIEAAIAVVMRNGKVLICQRRNDDDALPGYWEFPGGKCEDGETLEQCLIRELREEVNIDARPIRPLPPIEHGYPHALIRLHPFLCEHADGEPQLLECQQAFWIEPQELRKYRFPPANEDLIERVIEHFQLLRSKESNVISPG